MAESIARRPANLVTPIVIALELQSTQAHGALINETGRILATRTAPIKQTTVRATVAALSQLVLELAGLPERKSVAIRGIGISVPGNVDQRAARVSFTHHDSFHWERVPLGAMIERALETSGVDIRFSASASPRRIAKMDSAHPPFAVCANRDAQVAAETWCGAAEGKSHVVFLDLDVPLTAGILTGGRILHGAGDLAGAIGFWALNTDSISESTPHGTLAAEANEAALVRRTLEQWAADSDSLLSQLVLSDPAQLTAPMILRAARSNDPLALLVVAETCDWVGRAVANLISLLNPETVVLGGNFGLQLKPFLSHIRRAAKRWASPTNLKQCQITVTKLGPQVRLIGAARMAWMKVE